MNSNVTKSVADTSPLPYALLLLAVSGLFQAASIGRSEAAPALLVGKFSGGSHGVSVGLGLNASILLAFNSAQESCPCKGTNGVARSTTMPSLNVLGAISARTNTAYTIARKTSTVATTTESATVGKAAMFGGLITADAIVATARLGASATAFETSSSGTSLVNLVIAGQVIDPDVAENTSYALPGLGTVTVKYVAPIKTAQAASIEVDGLLVTINVANKYGLAVGSRIAIASAVAGYSRVQPQVVLGGYSQTANVNGDATALATGGGNIGAALAFPICTDTNGETETRTTENLEVTGLATAATATVTAFGGLVGSANVAKTTSNLSNVSLLGGLVTADSLVAVAQETKQAMSNTASAASTAGSGFTGLKIGGLPVASTIRPNTTVTLPGLARSPSTSKS